MYIPIRRTPTKIYEHSHIPMGINNARDYDANKIFTRFVMDCIDINETWGIRKQRNKITVLLTNRERESIKEKGYYIL